MSKSEIIEHLPKLSAEEREEVRAKLDELDGWLDEDDPLSEAEKRLIDQRLEAHRQKPQDAVPWKEFEARLKRRLAK